MSSAATYSSRFFRAENRPKFSLPGFQAYHTEFENQVLVQDVFIPPGGSLTVDVSRYPHHLIIPVVGGIVLSRRGSPVQELIAGDICYLPGNEEALLSHPFKEPVNFLHVALASFDAAPAGVSCAQLDISEKNCLLRGDSWSGNIYLGVYDSRSTQDWKLTQLNGSLFTFVLNGSFDFEGRLMEYRDGLFQWDVSEIEFEALSDAAIILMIECSPIKL
ncbi:MAG: hypothetical protein QM743_02770 [Chitinophagaceae bacterium]